MCTPVETTSPGVMVTWRAGFYMSEPDRRMMRPSMTLLEIVSEFPGLPSDFLRTGEVCINGEIVPRAMWGSVRPRPTSRTRPISVTLHRPLQGGGGGNAKKQVIGLVALLALTLLTAGISSGALLAGASGTLAATLGITAAQGAALLSGTVGLLGALAISALVRPPQIKKPEEDSGSAKEAASASGNVLSANGSVPRVVGTRRIFPPMACEPSIELIGDDEYATALYILNGPHAISEIRIGDADIDDDDLVEYQIREGWPSDPLQTLIDHFSRTNTINMELVGHKVSPGSGFALGDQTAPGNSYPKWHRVATKNGPDQVALQFLWPANVAQAADATITINQALRLRIRALGAASWTNLPELHVTGGLNTKQIRAQVILHWDYTGTRAPLITGAPLVYAHTRVPGQTDAPADSTYQWEADSYFYSGSGDRYLNSANAGTTGVQNVGFDANGDAVSSVGGGASGIAGYKTTMHVYLDSATFPTGVYEIEVMRSSAYRISNFVFTSYTYGGSVRNFFTSYLSTSTYRLAQTQTDIVDNVALARVISIWNQQPLPLPGFATIAVRAKNKSLQQLSCLASGYVPDWDGVGWDDWTTTSNPAPHYRDMLVGQLNLDPVSIDLIDDDRLVEWRQHCIDNDYTVDAIIESMTLDDALSLVASCGYARPYRSDIYSVIVDYDRSAEGGVQTFTPRNSRGFRMQKPFPRLPDGLRVSYRSNSQYEQTQETTVYRDGVEPADNNKLEQVTYEGLIDTTKVETRALYDLRQGIYRSTFYMLEAPAEHLVCRRGSLVEVAHDLVTQKTGWGRIISRVLVSGNIESITLDSKVQLYNTIYLDASTDLSAETDLSTLGMTPGCNIRRTDGTETTHTLSNVTGETETLTFATPIPDDYTAGSIYDGGTIPEVADECLVVVGAVGFITTRHIVMEIRPDPENLSASMVLVDEAPELWE